ncbi:Protein hairless [Orchesella cincta]|uniref:Protein hairless n=1 Tax=Orchesella cincta TaxID=48709 RepID=A0A1D2NN12_ORCCI|nr:Protein hairless [Orchesella cincta]
MKMSHISDRDMMVAIWEDEFHALINARTNGTNSKCKTTFKIGPMQIMSSPSMSDAADTPVSGSGGSPSPQSPLSTTKQILDFSKKECDETDPRNTISPKLIESTESERSVNSSPATLVPTPRSTPPMNGILTPPNDAEGSSESSKSSKPGGRLKFFKDGILCLELTHHGEGERTKWTQIRTKTVFPTLVHTVKEATIPCHSTPSSFASPSSLTHNHRVESSTSHSLSDDASSMLSSPRVRESHWKQSVPQRGVSACLQLYMKPAPCALKVRRKLKDVSQDQLRKRWPYDYQNLEKLAESQASIKAVSKCKSVKSNGDTHELSGKRCSSTKQAAVAPKKRLFNEVEPREPSTVRPKKKSPNRSLDVGKTILNVPGLNSEFYKRHSMSKANKSPVAGPDLGGFETRHSRHMHESAVVHNKRNNRSPHFGAKSNPPGTSSSTLLKPGITTELVDHYPPVSSSGRGLSRISDEHASSIRHQDLSSQSLEQKLFQQHTVSKAINYTIQSLLGTGGDPPASLSSKQSLKEQGGYSQSKEASSHGHLQNIQKGSRHSSPINCTPTSRPDQDQKSFLRHLLDTSDPIPKATDRTNKNSSRSTPVNHNNRTSGLKTSKASSNNNHEVRTNSPGSIPKSTGRNNAPTQGSLYSIPKDPVAEAHQNLATNIALSSLMSFPMNMTPPYDLLTRGANQHSADALTAAAAALQYGSLIPGNFFPPVNSTMAAAVAASYLGVMPNLPMAVPPPTSRHSPSPKSNHNVRRNQETPNSANPRSWPGMVNGHPPGSSPPFRSTTTSTAINTNNSQNSPLRFSSAISSPVEVSSCGALNLSEKKKSHVPEPVDMDAPLDLCKKSSR